jgi:hypothetical protein
MAVVRGTPDAGDPPMIRLVTSELADLGEGQEAGDALVTFVACAHAMLDPSTPEEQVRRLEPRLLAQLPTLRALGVFELFEVRDPALAALLADEEEASIA